MTSFNKSRELQKKALQVLAGGVNSPVRSFKAVGGKAIFINSAKGSKVIDADGNSYIDYVGAYGPMILGHADTDVNEAVYNALQNGCAYGANSEKETILAGLILEAYPYYDKVRFVNSGTEAVMSAIRLARGFTGRSKIIKFSGCYHGHMDDLLVAGGSGVATLGLPDSAGVTKESIQNTIVVPYNNITAVRKAFKAFKNTIAAVIIEPVAGNMNLVLPQKNFLPELGSICKSEKTLLISDEIMCGFRKACSSVMLSFGVNADITCLGKIIGGGLPVGAYLAKAEIMDYLAPQGPVYQAGTLSGSPLVMAAGIITLQKVKKPGFFKSLINYTTQITKTIAKKGMAVNQFGSMFGFFFDSAYPANFDDVLKTHTDHYSVFFEKIIEAGLFVPPSPFETWFVSAAHTIEDIEITCRFFENYKF